LTLKAAAQALGVSQQTVLKKLNAAELEGVRVQAGAPILYIEAILSQVEELSHVEQMV